MATVSQRNVAYDFVRIVACVLVIYTHCPMHTAESVNHSFFLSSMTFLVRPCIGLFFMISGALLLPIKGAPGAFFKRRLTKVLFPTLLWTLVYIILMDMRHNGIVSAIVGMPFVWQGHPILWYMYTLIGLYLLTPVLSAWLESCSKRLLEGYLVLWAVTLCYPYISLFTLTETGTDGVLYYFTGFVGYYVLGYYMKRYGTRVKLLPLGVMAAAAYCVPIAYRVLGWTFDQSYAFGYLSLVTAVITLFFFVAICRLTDRIAARKLLSDRFLRATALVSNLTFGVYLTHILVLKFVVWPVMPMITGDYCLQSLLAGVVAFGLSVAVCYLLAKLPNAAYIIGFSLSRRKTLSNAGRPENGGGNLLEINLLRNIATCGIASLRAMPMR